MIDITQFDELGYVVESSTSMIVIELASKEILERHKSSLQIGKHVLVANGNNEVLVTSIQSVKAVHQFDSEHKSNFRFLVSAQPVGTYSDDYGFERGAKRFPVPTELVYAATSTVLEAIYTSNTRANFELGALAQNRDVKVLVDGDRFFSKHVAIAGSTGSGKSCLVAKILQNVVGIHGGKNRYSKNQRNAHVVIYDIHSEYKAAFSLVESQNFSLNYLDVSSLKLPYWLMNAEELEAMFIEGSEQGAHNQISQFRHAVIRNKEIHNPSVVNLAFDTPVYFDIQQVCNYIDNMNNEMIGKCLNENKPKIIEEHGKRLIENRDEYFDKKMTFVPQSGSTADKASSGPFNGDFDRLHLRLINKISDRRLSFFFESVKLDGTPLKSEDFPLIVQQFIGYITKSNVTILDLSGVPFEVLNIVVSLVSRIIFDFSFNYSKICHAQGELNNAPVMIVCEEAHNYVPRVATAANAASRRSIERIAKEGRKYGATLMVVSQRPSEVSETIFSQCSNFISLRLTNINDQNYIKGLLPDVSNGLVDLLPNLAQGEFLAVGDAILVPSIGIANLPVPEPHSSSVDYYVEWNKVWQTVNFDQVIARWRKDSSAPSPADPEKTTFD